MTQAEGSAPGADPDELPEIEHVDDFHHHVDAPNALNAREAPFGPAQAVASPEPDTPQAQNRRTHTRYIAHWRAALVGDKVKTLGKTDNASLSGVAIISDINLRANQVVKIYLEIPLQLGKPPVVFRALGRVVHSMLSQQSFKIGVVFSSFEEDSENLLRKALASGTYRELFDQNAS